VTPGGRGERACVLSLLAFVPLLFPDVALRGRVFYERDLHLLWYSQVESFVHVVRSGSWPVWDPYVSFGHPMLGNPNTQVLYPFTWLNLLMSPESFYVAYVFAHLAFSAVGLFLLAGRLGLPPLAATAAAATWTASGPLLSTVNLWNHLAGAAWLPWAFLAAERTLASPSVRAGIGLGFALGLQLLAGSPDLSAFTVLGIAAYAVARARTPEIRTALRPRLSALLVATILAAGLAAGMLWPALEAARAGARWNLDPARRTTGSLHPLGLPVKLLSPAIPAELPLTPAAAAPMFDAGLPLLRSPYLGLPALALVLAAFTPSAGRGRLLLAGLAGGALLFALGDHTPVYGVLSTLLPPIRALRYPSKAVVLAAFAFALLAGKGCDTWRSVGEGTRRRWLWGVAIPMGLLALGEAAAAVAARDPGRWLPELLVPEAALGVTWRQAFAPTAARLAVASLLSLVVAALALGRSFGLGGSTAPAVVVLAIADLWLANHTINRTTDRAFYRYRPPLLDAVEPGSRVWVRSYDVTRGELAPNPYLLDRYPEGLSYEAGPVLGTRLYLLPPLGGAWGIFGSYDPDILGLYPLQLEELVAAMRSAGRAASRGRLLELGAVQYVAALDDPEAAGLDFARELPSLLKHPLRLYRVREPLPRSYAVGRAQVLEDAPALALLQDPSFDPQADVVLAGTESPAGLTGRPGTTRVLELRGDRVRIEATLPSQGYVVDVGTWDAGWRASVDGREVPLLRANVAFRAVAVPAGSHRVELVYRPLSVRLGLLVSVIALVAGLVVAWARPSGAVPRTGAS
jgi:Bacterial membrane protein YfhO